MDDLDLPTRGIAADLLPSAWQFRTIMFAPALAAARGVLDPSYRKRDLRSPEELSKIIDAYRTLSPSGVALRPDVPKTIWMLWQQGWDKAPALVRACAESWKRQNPDWDLRLLDETDLDTLIPGYEANLREGMTRQTRALAVPAEA